MMGAYITCIKCGRGLSAIRQGVFEICVHCYKKRCKVKYKKKSDRRIKKKDSL